MYNSAGGFVFPRRAAAAGVAPDRGFAACFFRAGLMGRVSSLSSSSSLEILELVDEARSSRFVGGGRPRLQQLFLVIDDSSSAIKSESESDFLELDFLEDLEGRFGVIWLVAV